MAGDPKSDMIFKYELDKFDGVPYKIENLSHCHYVDEFIVNAACIVDPHVQAVKKKEDMPECVFEFVKLHTTAVKAHFKALVRLIKTFPFIICGAWAHTVLIRKGRFRFGLANRGKWHWLYGFNSRKNACLVSDTRKKMRDASSKSINMLKLCSLAKFDKSSEVLGEAFENGGINAMYKSMSPSLRKQIKTRSIRILDGEGIHCQTATQETYILRNRFAEMLCGEVMQFLIYIKEIWTTYQRNWT